MALAAFRASGPSTGRQLQAVAAKSPKAVKPNSCRRARSWRMAIRVLLQSGGKGLNGDFRPLRASFACSFRYATLVKASLLAGKISFRSEPPRRHWYSAKMRRERAFVGGVRAENCLDPTSEKTPDFRLAVSRPERSPGVGRLRLHCTRQGLRRSPRERHCAFSRKHKPRDPRACKESCQEGKVRHS